MTPVPSPRLPRAHHPNRAASPRRPPVTAVIPLAIGARNTYASNFTSRQAMRRSRNERGVTIDVKRWRTLLDTSGSAVQHSRDPLPLRSHPPEDAMRVRPRHRLCCVPLLLLPVVLGAQDTGAIRGRVTDAASGQPIVGARVTLEGTALSTGSSAIGAFFIGDVPVGQHLLLVRRVGYASARQEVTVAAGDTVEANIPLRAVAVSLDAIVVTGAGAPAERK